MLVGLLSTESYGITSSTIVPCTEVCILMYLLSILPIHSTKYSTGVLQYYTSRQPSSMLVNFALPLPATRTIENQQELNTGASVLHMHRGEQWL
jgi:hypothetical protein